VEASDWAEIDKLFTALQNHATQPTRGARTGTPRKAPTSVLGQDLLGSPSGTALGDGWVRSACIICLNRCGILAHVTEDGTVDKILGDPDNPHNHGKTCAKGDSGMEGLRDPNRIATPLRRTNPEKGIGIDPKWVPISWEEALADIARRLKAIRDEDPRGLLFSTFDAYQLRGPFIGAWINAFGLPGYSTWSAQIFCGNNVHGISYMNQSAFEGVPDPVYSKYIMLFGSQFGSVVHYDTMHAARALAERRPGNLHIVSIDPVRGPAASRAEEWVPIRPGTDAALLLGMVNQLINELNIYDEEFVKHSTNGPYLVGPDGLYVREPGTRKPLVWDAGAQAAKPFDADVGDFALTGTYQVHGVEAKPGFQRLKDHVRTYSPEHVEEITTVPATTVVRLAREYEEASQIGSTIDIDGHALPYRPASVVWYRGLSAHKHAMLTGLAIALLPALTGALDVPGGLLADPYGLRGKSPSREPQFHASFEGLIEQSFIGGGRVGGMYPPREASPPLTPEYFELLPVGPYGAIFYLLASEQPDVWKPPNWPKMLFQYHSNIVKTSGPPDVMERFMKRFEFVVSVTRRFEETTEFADIVLPDLHYLERLAPFVFGHFASGDGEIANFGSKPVVHAPFGGPFPDETYVDIMQILLDLAKRAGFVGDVYERLNAISHLKPEYALDPGGDHPYIDIVDRMLKNEYGPDKGLEWHLADGLWTSKKTVFEKYPRPFVTPRAQIYFEFMKPAGEDLARVTEQLGIPWETEDYQTLPDFRPCPSFRHPSPHDLYLMNLKLPQHALSHTHANPLLSSLSARHRDLAAVMIHPNTAAKYGIVDGDRVTVETFEGRTHDAWARVTNLVHPEVLATQGCGGGWSKGPTDEVNFNALLTIDAPHIDFLSGALDCCISARVYRAGRNGDGR
jgi:anaerobic selenocysteine-containing dehydrogenase